MITPGWYAVKTVCKHRRVEDGIPKTLFEERVVLLQVADFADAIAKGEAEVRAYCQRIRGAVYTGYINIYRLPEDTVGHGTEVFSLMRESALADGDYLDHFYDDGNERAQIAE